MSIRTTVQPLTLMALLLNPITASAVGGGSVNTTEAHKISSVTDAWRDMDLSANTLANGALFAQAVGQNGGDPGLARINTATGKVQYGESDGGTHDHGEEVDVIALVGDLVAQGIDGEVGTVNPYVSGFGMIKDITFQRSYSNPVMFAQVTTALGAPAISVMPTNVQSTWGRLKFYEPSFADGTHWGETIHWAVIDAGTYDLPNGQRLVVGKQAVATTDGADFDTVSLQGQFLGDVAVVANIQQFNNHKYQGTRVKKSPGVDGTVTRFGVRFMGQTGSDGNMTGVIGYMALGTPWSMAAGRVAFSKSDGTSTGIDWASHTNGKCYNLSDEGFDDVAASLTFQANGYRTGVVVYENAWCTGEEASITASGTNTATLNLASGALANKASSFRVMWTQEERLYDRDCYAPGDVILENALGWLIFQDDGDLVLYRYMPADGSLSVAWHADTAGTEACFQSDGNLVVKGQFQVFGMTINGTVWASGTDGQNVSHMVLQNDCNLVIRDTTGQARWATGTNDCWKDVSAATANTIPSFSLGYADVDGDNDEELILIASQKDGSGYLLMDPFGIADFTYNSLGWGLGEGDDFWASLSATQQTILLGQTSTLGTEYGTTIEGVELEAILGQGSISADYRSYNSFRFTGSGTGIEASVSHGIETTTLTIGDATFLVESDEFGVGYELEATAVSLSYSVGGYVTTEASFLSTTAASNVDSNAFAFGGGVELVEVAWTLGDENATYASVSYGVGLSCYAAARFGKADQYGFTLDVPVVPVGVAFYIKGSDAVAAWEGTSALSVNAALTVAEMTEELWIDASALAQSVSGDLVVGLENTASEMVYAFSRAGDELTVIASTAGNAVATFFTDDVAGAFEAVEGALNDGIEAVTDAVTSWASDAGDAVTDVIESTTDIAEDVVDTAEDTVKSVVKTFKKWF